MNKIEELYLHYCHEEMYNEFTFEQKVRLMATTLNMMDSGSTVPEYEAAIVITLRFSNI